MLFKAFYYGIMEIIEINNNFHNMIVPVIVCSVSGGIILYLLLTLYISTSYKARLKKAKKLILEGHSKAKAGRKDDGLYSESKRLRG